MAIVFKFNIGRCVKFGRCVSWDEIDRLQSLSSHRLVRLILVGVSAEFGTLGGMLISYSRYVHTGWCIWLVGSLVG